MIWIILSIFLLLAVLLYLFPPIQICGNSMYPALRDGDIGIGCRIYKLKLNSIYVYEPPVGRDMKNYYVVKRVSRIIIEHPIGKIHRNRYGFYGNIKVFFEGDNRRESFDSNNYGTVDANKIVAKYLFTIYRKRR